MPYNITPQASGAMTPSRTGFTGAAGYQNMSQQIPFYQGRSMLATIPDYLRDPMQFSKDLMVKIGEGRLNMMKLIYDFASRGGLITRPDVKYRWQVEVQPHDRIYLKQSSSHTATRFYIDSLATIPTTIPEGLTDTANRTRTSLAAKRKIVGDIARLEQGDFLLLMFSYVDPRRTAHTTDFHNGAPQIHDHAFVVPEIARVVNVNYELGYVDVERNWAGSQRTAASTGVGLAPVVIANSATVDAAGKVEYKNAFVIKLPNSMKEDEISAKVRGLHYGWDYGTMQRSLRGWGAGFMSEVINANLGNPSMLAKNKGDAVLQFYKEIEYQAIYGEGDEGFDPETGEWWGMTDGFLSRIPKGHYVGLKPVDFANWDGTSVRLNSFQIPIFNKILENKGYIGSQNKILLCGSEFHTCFSTMINHMTQNIPDIKSEWSVVGKRFTSSNGLSIDVVPSDTMSLNGMQKMAFMIDPQYFRLVGLQNYPLGDIVEVNGENPLRKTGFIHGVYSFANMNPDAQWVFILDSNAHVDGSSTAE